jgi:hypothetical protein
MGRNMFSPVRGPWKDDGWKGWWGDDPPFHHPVFVDYIGDVRGSTADTEADLRISCYVGGRARTLDQLRELVKLVGLQVSTVMQAGSRSISEFAPISLSNPVPAMGAR